MSGVGNTTSRTLVDMRDEWRRFDRLSPEMRRLMAFAPYDYMVKVGEKRTPGEFIDFVFRDRDEDILETYGPDHPQIGSHSREIRPRARKPSHIGGKRR